MEHTSTEIITTLTSSKNDYGNFWKNIPADCEKAIKELRRLKVFGCMAFDYETTFADVWWLALHEVDLWVEGEFGQEAWHEDIGGMNRQQAKRADEWLIRWLPLFNKYKTPNYCGDDEFDYWGQVE